MAIEPVDAFVPDTGIVVNEDAGVDAGSQCDNDDACQNGRACDGRETCTGHACVPGVAIMCSEATPWRCHRSLVADALTARALAVEHIMSATKANPHRPTPFAHVEGQHVTYPGGDDVP